MGSGASLRLDDLSYAEETQTVAHLMTRSGACASTIPFPYRSGHAFPKLYKGSMFSIIQATGIGNTSGEVGNIANFTSQGAGSNPKKDVLYTRTGTFFFLPLSKCSY